MAIVFQFTGSTLYNWERIIDFGAQADTVKFVFARQVTYNTLAVHTGIGTGATWEEQLYMQDVVNQNTIYRIALTFNPLVGAFGQQQFWVNGSVVDTRTQSSRPLNMTNERILVGKSNWSNNGCLNGIIYSLKLYNRVLPQWEIQRDLQLAFTVPPSTYSTTSAFKSSTLLLQTTTVAAVALSTTVETSTVPTVMTTSRIGTTSATQVITTVQTVSLPPPGSSSSVWFTTMSSELNDMSLTTSIMTSSAMDTTTTEIPRAFTTLDPYADPMTSPASLTITDEPLTTTYTTFIPTSTTIPEAFFSVSTWTEGDSVPITDTDAVWEMSTLAVTTMSSEKVNIVKLDGAYLMLYAGRNPFLIATALMSFVMLLSTIAIYFVVKWLFI